MTQDPLKNYLRKNDGVSIGHDRFARVRAAILEQAAQTPQLAALAYDMPDLRRPSWLAGAALMLMLGVFTGYSLPYPYAAQDMQAAASPSYLAAGVWQSYDAVK